MPQAKYSKVTCPACGGPLPEGGAQVRCPYCDTLVERTTPEPSKIVVQIPVQSGPSAPTMARRASCIALVAGIFVLITAGVVAWMLVVKQGTEPLANIIPLRRMVQANPILLPSPKEGPDDILVVNLDYDSGSYLFTLVDGTEHTRVWDSPPLSSDITWNRIAVGGGLLFTIDETRLLALNRADGTLAWETILSDKLFVECHGCLRFLGNMVIVLSDDGNLQAFEAATGQPAWSEMLNETPRDLWVIGSRIAVLDQENEEDWKSVVLQLRDPSTGKVVQRLPASCDEDRGFETMSIYSPNVIVSPRADAVYFLYGLLPACAQRWDPQSGQLVWQTGAEDEYFDRFPQPPFWAGDTLYGGYDGILLTIDAESGELRRLADERDYDLAALAVQDDVLITLAKRTRGTQRYELWGVDRNSGERLWQFILEADQMVDWTATHQAAWAWHMTSEGLVVAHFFPEPNRILLVTLDPATGMVSSSTTADMAEAYWNGVAWSNSMLWVANKSLYAVELKTGSVLYTWP